MAYGKQQLRELAQKLNKIKEQLSFELPEFWWFSQGEAAIVSVRKLTRDKELRVFETPKLSLKAALKLLIDNIEVIEQLKGSEFYRALRILEEDISKIIDAYKAVRDAHSIVEEIEHTKRLLKQRGLHVAKEKEIEAELNTIITWIRDILTGNFYEWKNRKEKIELLLSKIRERIQSL